MAPGTAGVGKIAPSAKLESSKLSSGCGTNHRHKKKKKGLIPSDPHPVSMGAARTLQAGAAPMGRLSLLSPAPKYHCLYRGALRQVEQGKTDGMRDYDEREGCSPGSGQDFPFELCR